MQVSVESTGTLERKMTVQVPAEQIEGQIESRLKDLARKVKLDGFRPGKVPYRVVKQKYDGHVRQEVLGEVIDSSFREALQQEKLIPAGGPKVEPKNMTPGEALEYSAIFEVYPEITLASLENLSIEKPVAEVSDADVDTMLEKLRKQRVTWNNVDREAQLEDQVTISFEGSIDGEKFEGGKGENVPLVLGSNRMIPGFEDQLFGAKEGEQRTLNVTFPEDYANKALAGKAAQFATDIVSVAEPQLPELDDEFANSLGVSEGLDAFRNEVKNNMQNELQNKLSAITKQRVMDILLEANTVELPQALVDDEINRSMKQALEQQPQSMRNLNLPRELFEDQARKRVALGLLIGEVSKQMELKIDPERVKTTLQQIASSYEHPEEVIKAYRKDKDLMRNVEGLVLEEQVTDHLLAQLQVNEIQETFESIMNPKENAEHDH